jgi:hypothetical protein
MSTVSDDKVQLSMSLPLDSDGFLRRECPTCERELKWRPTPEVEESVPVPDGGYFCPYCGVQASPNAWLTKAQAALVQQIVQARVVDPILEKFGDDLQRIARNSRGAMSVSMRHERTEEPEPLSEDDDMRRVDFACHPSEPVKVLEGWSGHVRCLICGEAKS